MKKRYGIGFLIGMIFLTLVVVCAYQFSYDRTLRKQEAQLEAEQKREESVIPTKGTAKKEDSFIIREKDGYVIVYYSDNQTVFEYTTIEVQYLPENIQKELKTGRKAENVGQVYGFLENYSS